jgi:hypothetical protein
MARIYSQVVSQREDLSSHPFYKQLMAAARKIGPAHRTGKQSVPREHGSGSTQAHAAGRMAGRVDDRDAVSPDSEDLSFFQKALRPRAECSGIEAMNQNRSLCDSLQFSDTAHVVDMAVGDRDILYGEA